MKTTLYTTQTQITRIEVLAKEAATSRSGIVRRLVDKAWAARSKCPNADVASTDPALLDEAAALQAAKAAN